jgi:hypothetical protein
MMRSGWTSGRIAAAVFLLTLVALPARADTDPLAATGNRAARNEAMHAIPWKDLDTNERRAVQQVVSNATIYRRMPTHVFDCDPAVFNFLGQNPDVVTELWKMMGVSTLQLKRIGPDTYRATDNAGTSGTMRFLSTTWSDDAQNLALVYCEGTYEGAPLPRAVTARSVLLLRSGSTVETNGRPYVTARLDSFVLVDRLGAELVAKTIQPLLVQTADHNFVETMKFVGTFSKTAENNPAGMKRLAGKLQNLDEPTRLGMVEVCSKVAARYQSLSAMRRDTAIRLASQRR